MAVSLVTFLNIPEYNLKTKPMKKEKVAIFIAKITGALIAVCAVVVIVGLITGGMQL
jgi:hypothetical protein